VPRPRKSERGYGFQAQAPDQGVYKFQQTTIRTSLRLVQFIANGFRCDMLPSATTLFVHGVCEKPSNAKGLNDYGSKPWHASPV
jgi:hypothetical protein